MLSRVLLGLALALSVAADKQHVEEEDHGIVKDVNGFNVPLEYRRLKRILDSDTNSNTIVPCNPNIVGLGGCSWLDVTGASVNPTTGVVTKGANANYASAGTPSGAVGNVDYALNDPMVAYPENGTPYGMHITPESETSFIISWQAYPAQVGRYYSVDTSMDPKCTTAMPNIKLGYSSGMYCLRFDAQCVRFVRDYSKATPAACPQTNMSAPCFNYVSPYIFHARVSGLMPNTTYYYVVGDSSFTSAEKSFTTVSTMMNYPFVIGALVDVGQTPNSTRTRDGILGLPPQERPNVLLQPGDFTYADNYMASFPDYETCNSVTNPGGLCVGSVNQRRWDTFVKLFEPLYSTIPMIHVGGNHELEGGAGCYISGNGAVWYPSAAPTTSQTLQGQTITWPTLDFGPANPCFQSYNFRFPHPFTATWGDMSYSSNYHGMDYGPIHVVSLNNYIPFGTGTPQYLWFLRHMQTVDRSKTPWLIVQFHSAAYHTYYTHYKEMDCFLSLYEPLFVAYGVDIVLNGHVHAYERTHPMYNYQLSQCGPIYLTLGDAGNNEGPYRNGVEEKIDPSGRLTNLTFCEVTTAPGNLAASKSPLDVGISPTYQRMAHPPNCMATSWQTVYSKNPSDTTGLEPNPQDSARYWCQKSQPKWSAYRDPSFGFATITLLNDTTALFKWHRNIDPMGVVADSTTVTRAPPGACAQEAPPAASSMPPPSCAAAASNGETCGTSVFNNPAGAMLSVNFQNPVRLTSVTMWNEDGAGATLSPPLYTSPAQLQGLDVRIRDGTQSASCSAATPDMMMMPPPQIGYYAMSLLCDTGRGVDIAAPNLARASVQQTAKLMVRVCVANMLAGPRNVSLYLKM